MSSEEGRSTSAEHHQNAVVNIIIPHANNYNPPANSPTRGGGSGGCDVLVDDLVFSICAYLPARDLLHVGNACTRFRDISGDNTLWRPLYELERGGGGTITTITTTHDAALLYRDQYLQLFYNKMQERLTTQAHQMQQAIDEIRFERAVKISTYAEIFFIKISPLLMWILLITGCVMLPLLHDGIVVPSTTNTVWCMIPWFLLAVLYMALLVFTVADRWYIEYRLYRMPGSHAYYCFDSEMVTFVRLTVLGFHPIPLSVVCIAFKLIFAPETASPWSALLSPVFVTSSLYAIGTVISLAIGMRIEGIVYLLIAAVMLVFNIQAGLVCGKLDNVILSSWSVVFLPIWICFGACIAAIIIAPPILRCVYNQSTALWFMAYTGLPLLFCSPLLAFFVALAVRLDYAGYLFIYVWPSLWLFMLFCMFLTGYIALPARIERGAMWEHED